MQTLTKSNYLIGLQCSRYLWTIFYEPEKIPEANIVEEFKFKEGEKVGEFAKKLFPDGMGLSTEDYVTNLEKTKEALKLKKPLFEAGFEFNDCFARADILVPNGNKWDILEVKSGTKIKDVNIDDVAFQKYVYENNGLKIRKCFLVYLNKEFVKTGELIPEQLFVKQEISSEVDKALIGMKEKIAHMFKIIESRKAPEIKIGKHCKDPYECPLKECWKFLPENNIFYLYRGGRLSYELFDKDFYTIKEIPDEIKLNDKQKIQKECEISGKCYIDKKKIRAFLNKLKYPIYFLDFETFGTAIPMFDGAKTYQQIPFQFSLHVAEKKGELKHYEFLYRENSDPRKEFILALKKNLSLKGSIVVYNQSFESNRLKELAEQFPEHKQWVDGVLSRIIDLLVPFREFSYYNAKQQGSASIKDVLPALTEISYKGMEIKDGGSASVEFFNVTYNKCSEEVKKEVRKNLLKYCKQDTLAEVMIVEKLRELVK